MPTEILLVSVSLPGVQPFRRRSGRRLRRRARPQTGQQDRSGKQKLGCLQGARKDFGREPALVRLRCRQGYGCGEAAGLATVTFATALAVRFVVPGQAEVRKRAIGQNIGCHPRCDRHGSACRRLDEDGNDEHQRA